MTATPICLRLFMHRQQQVNQHGNLLQVVGAPLHLDIEDLVVGRAADEPKVDDNGKQVTAESIRLLHLAVSHVRVRGVFPWLSPPPCTLTEDRLRHAIREIQERGQGRSP